VSTKKRKAPTLRTPKVVAEIKKLKPDFFSEFILTMGPIRDKKKWYARIRDKDHETVFEGPLADKGDKELAAAVVKRAA
jgi:hypothetical protein